MVKIKSEKCSINSNSTISLSLFYIVLPSKINSKTQISCTVLNIILLQYLWNKGIELEINAWSKNWFIKCLIIVEHLLDNQDVQLNNFLWCTSMAELPHTECWWIYMPRWKIPSLKFYIISSFFSLWVYGLPHKLFKSWLGAGLNFKGKVFMLVNAFP